MASVIERHGTEVKDGCIFHDDRPASYEQAEKIAGRRLDRRKNYAIIDGQVAESCTWSQACSGCYEGYDSFHATGLGCDECGYTGRRKHGQWVPLVTPNDQHEGPEASAACRRSLSMRQLGGADHGGQDA